MEFIVNKTYKSLFFLLKKIDFKVYSNILTIAFKFFLNTITSIISHIPYIIDKCWTPSKKIALKRPVAHLGNRLVSPMMKSYNIQYLKAF